MIICFLMKLEVEKGPEYDLFEDSLKKSLTIAKFKIKKSEPNGISDKNSL